MATTTSAAEEPGIDQRTARRVRGREAVISAVLELIHEQSAIPAATEVAARAGVSPASLFRYFDSLDDMQHEAVRRHFEDSFEYFQIPGIGEGDLTERINRFTNARFSLHSHIEPIARFGRSRALEVPFFAESIRFVRLDQADQIRRHFGVELAQLNEDGAEDVVASIASITSFESWDLQVREMERTEPQVIRAWTAAVHALLGTP